MSFGHSRSAFRASVIALVVSVLATLGRVAVRPPGIGARGGPAGPDPVGASVTIHGRG